MDIEDAIIFATDFHHEQRDKAGRPYIWHPVRVALRLRDERELIVAILHDVVEDTSASLEQLAGYGLSAELLGALDALTKRPGEAYTAFVERVAQNPIARAVKIADLLDNLDPTRLDRLPKDEGERLRAKYRPALARLTGGHDASSKPTGGGGPERRRVEECDLTPEDEAILDQVWAELGGDG